MTQDQNRRLTDQLPAVPLHWDDATPRADEIRVERTNAAITAGVALLQATGTDAAAVLIPGPEARYVAVGDRAGIAKVLELAAPSANKAAAVDLTSLTRWYLSDEGMRPTREGPWVGYNDVAALLASAAPADEAKPLATVIKKGAERTWMSENLGNLPDGMYSLYTRAAPAAQPDANALLDKAAKIARGYVGCDMIAEKILALKSAAIAAASQEGATTSQPDEARDAARYRFLRQEVHGIDRAPYIVRDTANTKFGPSWLFGEEADSKIDAAMGLAPTAASPRGGSQETPSHPDPEMKKDAHEAFEAWANGADPGYYLMRHPNNNDRYYNARTQHAFEGFRAALASGSAPHPVQQQEQGDDLPRDLTPMLLLNAALIVEGGEDAARVNQDKRASIANKLCDIAEHLHAQKGK